MTTPDIVHEDRFSLAQGTDSLDIEDLRLRLEEQGLLEIVTAAREVRALARQEVLNALESFGVDTTELHEPKIYPDEDNGTIYTFTEENGQLTVKASTPKNITTSYTFDGRGNLAISSTGRSGNWGYPMSSTSQ